MTFHPYKRIFDNIAGAAAYAFDVTCMQVRYHKMKSGKVLFALCYCLGLKHDHRFDVQLHRCE